jgi:hypothetical protein
VAKKADVIVMVLGDNEQTSREAWADNHLGDRDSLDLIGQQNDLAKAIFDLGKPTVVFLLNGRPLSINLLAERADAIVEGWYLGAGDRQRRRRHPVRPGQSGRQAAGQHRPRRRPAADLLQPQAHGPPRLSVRRDHAALSVRLRAVLHQLRHLGPAPGQGRRSAPARASRSRST